MLAKLGCLLMSSEPIPVGYVLLPAAIVVTLSVVTGVWLLMRSLRTRSSKWLFGLVVALIAWIPTSRAIIALGSTVSNAETIRSFHPYALIWLEVTGYGVLSSAASICFLHVAWQAKGSFEPNPRRRPG